MSWTNWVLWEEQLVGTDVDEVTLTSGVAAHGLWSRKREGLPARSHTNPRGSEVREVPRRTRERDVTDRGLQGPRVDR